ncbi:MAG: hypothetical protein E7534_03920, partial [Ruminococcaceae bacterium]|nr:hypothetical protein [Oscillospiraceae bacterium]
LSARKRLPFGTVGDVREKALEMLQLAKKSGRLVLAPTHLLEPEVPLENIDMLVKTVQEFCCQS